MRGINGDESNRWTNDQNEGPPGGLPTSVLHECTHVLILGEERARILVYFSRISIKIRSKVDD